MDYKKIDTEKVFDVGKLKLKVYPNDSQLVFSLYENRGSLTPVATAHYSGNGTLSIGTHSVSEELRRGLRGKGKKLTEETTKILDNMIEEALRYYRV